MSESAKILAGAAGRVEPVIRIHPTDNVVIARHQLLGGSVLTSENLTVAGLVPPGHKMATRAIAAGEPVRRYDQIIGVATQTIAPGQHVHSHNLACSAVSLEHAPCSAARPTQYVAEPAPSTASSAPMAASQRATISAC